jgi:hypothetical protein
MIKRIYDEMNKQGMEPDKLITDQLKSLDIGKKINLESKLNMREKAAAKKKAKQTSDDDFTKQTGIVNEG